MSTIENNDNSRNGSNASFSFVSTPSSNSSRNSNVASPMITPTSKALFGRSVSNQSDTSTFTTNTGYTSQTTSSYPSQFESYSIQLDPLTSISPLDGRYWKTISSLSDYFSEYALLKYRVRVEIEYFIALTEIPIAQLKEIQNNEAQKNKMRSWYLEFSIKDAHEIKAIEKKTNHDVKAVEYWLKSKFAESSFNQQFTEYVHFGLTSNDINNTAIPFSLKLFMDEMYLPNLNIMIDVLSKMANEWINIPMLARTHGQVATPTRVGKEIMVFVERLQRQMNLLKLIPFSAKFGGATGNFNAHYVTYPNINWILFATRFVEKFGLEREIYTTQISHYDNIASLCDNIRRINIILIDLCRDFWTYISLDYFKQKINSEEVGSSAMPHKVNPIDFENAEGNLGVANSLFEHLAMKLPISRLQRDLTDSTVLRNLGVPFGHTILSFNSLSRGISKLILNKEVIYQDLEENWIVISEAIQTILRRESYPKPYEALKKLTRTGNKISRQSMVDFVNGLSISDTVKEELQQISPFNYIGIVPKVVPSFEPTPPEQKK